MKELWFTRWVNDILARPTAEALRLLHVTPQNPRAPIPNHVAMEILLVLIVAPFATWLRFRLSVENPGVWQHLVESLWTALKDQADEVIGHDARRFLNFLFTLTVFILIANLIGLVPTLSSPTADSTVPLALAVVAFFYYHAAGIRRQGAVKYALSFFGPISEMPLVMAIFIAPLMLIIETISHFARILSLTVRLWANMYAGDLLISIFMALLPVLGVLFMGLHFFVAILQAYIFVLLTMVYLSGAVAEHHGGNEGVAENIA